MTTPYELAPCPACRATAHDVVADGEAVRAEVEALWEHHTGSDHAPLAIEQLVDRVAFSQDPPLRVVRCTGCGLLFRSPQERRVREIYENERPGAAMLAALRTAQLDAARAQLARLTELHGGTGRLLEVGSYAGAYLQAAAEAGWRAIGMDVNRHAVEFMRGFGHDVAVGAIEDVPDTARFDAIAFWNCFDQLPDPLAAAHTARARLRAGGTLALRVPNGEFYLALRGRLDGPLGGAARALLARHNLLAFPCRHGFTSASLRGLLERTGFEVVAEHGAGVLPAGDHDAALGTTRLLAAAERALRPLVGSPWLDVHARARRGRGPRGKGSRG